MPFVESLYALGPRLDEARHEGMLVVALGSPLVPASCPTPRRAALSCRQVLSGRFAGPMQTMAGRIMLLGALFVLALCAAASSAQASSGIQYGIQDDRGSSSAPARSTSASTTFSGSASRSSGSRCAGTRSPFVARRTQPRPDRASTASAGRVLRGLRRHGLRPCSRSSGLRRGRTAGARRTRSAARSRLPPLRDSRRPPLPLGSLLADLERAEQAALAQADEAGDLRPAPAQPRV